jgi:hypothetical protein
MEVFTGGFGPLSAENTNGTLEIFNYFSIINLGRYSNQDQPPCRTIHGITRSSLLAWKQVTVDKLYVVLGV